MDTETNGPQSGAADERLAYMKQVRHKLLEPSGHGEKLSRKQELAIAALMQHKTIRKAAEAVGVGEATLRRWMKIPAFQAAFRDARTQVLEEAIIILQKGQVRAAHALNRLISDPATPPMSIIAAVEMLYRLVGNAEGMLANEERLQALEQWARMSEMLR